MNRGLKQERSPESVGRISVKKNLSYLIAVGRRKTAVARVRMLKKGDGGFVVNNRPMDAYFPTAILQQLVREPLLAVKDQGIEGESFTFSVRVTGGGVVSQAQAVSHGVARVLLIYNPELRPRLKSEGLLTRDPRMKERKKPGLKRARRAPQWSKR